MHRHQRTKPSLLSSPAPLTSTSSLLTLSPFPSSSAPTSSASTSMAYSVLVYPPSAYHLPCSVLPRRTRCSETFPLPSSPSSPSLPSSPQSTSYPSLLSLFAWSVMLLLISSCIGPTDGGILNGHPLGKRSFLDIQCKGIYDKSIFARLDRICEDCYNLFREPQLHQLCRKNCFTSDYFKGCLDVLLLQDDVAKIQTWIKKLHGAEPGV